MRFNILSLRVAVLVVVLRAAVVEQVGYVSLLLMLLEQRNIR
jgi:hypothetical protein